MHGLRLPRQGFTGVLSCRAGDPRSSECRGSPDTLPVFSSSSELTCPPDRAPGHGSCVLDAALSTPWPTVNSAHRPAPPSGAWSVLTGFVLFHWFSSAALAAEMEPRLSVWPLPTQAQENQDPGRLLDSSAHSSSFLFLKHP